MLKKLMKVVLILSVVASAVLWSSAPALATCMVQPPNAVPIPCKGDAAGNLYFVPSTPSAGAGITGTSSGALVSSYVNAGAHSVFSLFLTTTTASGYLLVYDAATKPADGAVTPLKCYPVSAASPFGVSWAPGPALAVVNGIVAVFSTTGCLTQTSSATAYFMEEVQ